MNLRQAVPDYLTSKRNTFIQIAFTTLFAYAFINIYLPFGVEQWYNVNFVQFRILSGAVVLLGMAVIILTRLLMFQLQKNHEITLSLYIWMIVVEVILLGVFYTSIEKLVLRDPRNTAVLLLNAVQNTTLILLIPYLLSSLFFAWTDIKKKLDQVVQQFRDPAEVFVPFKDEKGNVRITLKLIDLLYIESNDNYVNIFYNDVNKVKSYMLRNTIKNMEPELSRFSVFRCHRRYSVNKVNVKFFRKGKTSFEVVINDKAETVIPVSKSYQKLVMSRLNLENKTNA